LITGGTTGIGRATAKILAGKGANVFIFGRHQLELDNAISEIQRVGNIIGITADVTKPDNVKNIYKLFDEKLGIIDVLINNASLAARGILDYDLHYIEYLVKTNILGYMLNSKYAIERMKKNGRGHIINIGSLSAEFYDENAELYVATKSAIRGFNNSLRKSVNQMNIKVALIEPGSVGTDLIDEKPREQRRLENEMRMLRAEDIGDAIAYILALPERCDMMLMQIKPHFQLI